DGRPLLLPYTELLASALHVGGALRARGLNRGDRVALVVPEVADFVTAFFGITVAGLVPVPLCPPAQAGDLATFTRQSRHILTASRASALVTTDDVARVLDDAGGFAIPIALVDTLRTGPALAAPEPTAVDAPGLLQFTSGSTAAQ